MPNNNQPLINGVRHSWASVKINFLNRTATGVSAISYGDKQDKVNNYGAGNFPISRGRGKYEANAKITLHAYESDAILKSVIAAGGERLQDAGMFDVIVAYLPEGSDTLITHVIRNCEFTDNKREVKKGDTIIESEHELICSHIQWT